jgi:hypothetical protein
MRRLVFPIIVASGLVMIGAVPRVRRTGPAARGEGAAGKKVCKVTDPSSTSCPGSWPPETASSSSTTATTLDSQQEVFFLDDECEITKAVDFSGNGPRDTEDMVLSPDGETLWIADIGDNESEATRPATDRAVDDAGRRLQAAEIHRLSYPAATSTTPRRCC